MAERRPNILFLSHRESAVSMIRMRPDMSDWVAVTDGRYRLTFDADAGEPVELFDVESDPDEATNLVATASTEHVTQLRDLAHATTAWPTP